MKVYILTIGRELYYVSKNPENAENEKRYMVEETFRGRNLGVKSFEVDITENWENHMKEKISVGDGLSYTIGEIMNLCE